MNFCYKKFLLFFFFLFFLDWVGVQGFAQNNNSQLPPPQFDMPETNQTSSGKIKLEWKPNDGMDRQEPFQFELQVSENEEFSEANTFYQGPNYAYYLSGLPNGTYYYRVRLLSNAGDVVSRWSDVVTVQVEHYSKGLTYTLLSLGGLVFLLTVGVVVHGTIKTS